MLDELLMAAKSALALGVPQGAVAYLRRALAADVNRSRRGEVLARLGLAEALAGQPEAAAHLEEAIAEIGDPDGRAKLAVGLAQLLKFSGHSPRAIEVLSELPPALDPTLNRRIQAEILSTVLISEAARNTLADWLLPRRLLS